MKKDKCKPNINLITIIASIILFMIGAMIFAYPAVSNYLAEKNQKEIIVGYDDTINELSEEEICKEWDEAIKYNENLIGEPLHDPFVYGSGYAIPDNYCDVLNINDDGVMAHIEIPKIGVNLPVYHGTSDEVLSKAAGHIEGSSLPIGMENMLSFISAHRGLPSATLFTDLDKLVINDKFYIRVLDKTIVYSVYKTETIEPQEIQYITNEIGKDIVILLTCTPYGVNTHRLLVYGEKIDEFKEIVDYNYNINVEKSSTWALEYAFAIVLGLIIIIAIILVYRIYKGKKIKNGRSA